MSEETARNGPGEHNWRVRITRPGDRPSLSRSATRALDVLELFGQLRRPLRAVEISRALDLHSSTTNQLLKTMVGSAHLTFEASTKSYLPSPRLARFAGWMVASYGTDERLRRLMRDVHEQTKAMVTLTTPNDLYMQLVELIDVLPDTDAVGAGVERGMQFSIFGSATGAAYLSMLSDAALLRLAHRARIPERDYPALLARVSQLRRDGVATEFGSDDGHSFTIAVALPAAASPAPLVLALGGPTERIQPDVERLKRRLIEAVARAGPFD